MFTVLVILAVITAVLLTLIVLVQESKGGGLASNFAGANELAGVRKTTDLVEKTTWTLAALLVLFSVSSVFFAPKAEDTTGIVTNAKTVTPVQSTQPTTPGTTAPAQ